MANSTKTCFIAMPVSTSTAQAELFGDADHWKHVMESLFVPAVTAAGFEPWLPIAVGSPIIHAELVRQLEQADMVLCDMSQTNPNVFFELGVRTSVNKPVALVRCDTDTPIPFDVSGINSHTYDPSLKAWLIQSEVESLAQHLRDAESSCAGENPIWRHFGLTLKANEPTSESSPTDARLEVITRQLASISGRLNTLSHGQKSSTDTWDFSQGNEVSGSPSVNETVAQISAMADDSGVACDVAFDQNHGFLISILGKPENPVGLRDFKTWIKGYLGLEDVPYMIRYVRDTNE